MKKPRENTKGRFSERKRFHPYCLCLKMSDFYNYFFKKQECKASICEVCMYAHGEYLILVTLVILITGRSYKKIKSSKVLKIFCSSKVPKLQSTVILLILFSLDGKAKCFIFHLIYFKKVCLNSDFHKIKVLSNQVNSIKQCVR